MYPLLLSPQETYLVQTQAGPMNASSVSMRFYVINPVDLVGHVSLVSSSIPSGSYMLSVPSSTVFPEP